MTQRRELDERLDLYADLTGILNAMRSFAMAELRRVMRRETAQQKADEALSQAIEDIYPALQSPERHREDVWVTLGSVRGFCGSLNEDIVRRRHQEKAPIAGTVAVGERLSSLMPEEDNLVRIPGAVSAVDATETIERIVSAVDDVRRQTRESTGLVICFRGEDNVETLRLLPFPTPLHKPLRNLPMMNEPAAKVAAGVAQHYVFHKLLSTLLRSLRVENHMRLIQMENALQHIERNRDALLRRRNQLRQEEIVEEIELILQRNSTVTTG